MKFGKVNVVPDLDIFSKIFARGLPYDEFIEITVKGDKVIVKVSFLVTNCFRAKKLLEPLRTANWLLSSQLVRQTTPRSTPLPSFKVDLRTLIMLHTRDTSRSSKRSEDRRPPSNPMTRNNKNTSP